MTDSPLISVCIPAYNHAMYVEATVRSVLAQEGPRMELIVIDDGSKDETWSVLQRLKPECEARFERVEMLTRENRGACRTYQQLIGLARGEFVTCIASDDQYCPGAFVAMMRPMLEDASVGVVTGENAFIDGEGRPCFWDAEQNVVYDETAARYRTFNAFLAEHTGVGGNDDGFGRYEELVRANHVPNGYLLRKSMLDKVVPYNPEAPLEDLWLHLQMSKVARYRMVPERTFLYRWHASNTVRQMDRMLDYGYVTLKCEERNVRAMADGTWLRRFQSASSEEQVRAAIGPVSYVKVKTLEEKRWALRVGGHEFVLKRTVRVPQLRKSEGGVR